MGVLDCPSKSHGQKNTKALLPQTAMDAGSMAAKTLANIGAQGCFGIGKQMVGFSHWQTKGKVLCFAVWRQMVGKPGQN